MKQILTAFFFFFCSVGLAVSGNDAGKPLMGFTRGHAADELQLEGRFDASLHREDLPLWLKELSSHPHNIGSPHDKSNAEYIAARLKSFGFETAIEQFKVLFPTPKTRLLEMIAPTSYTAKLAEPPVADDPTSSLQLEELPTYNVYSPDGDVTGELVYVNFGLPRDYEELDRRGIDVKGKIVITRYGGAWRGIKPKVAAEHGAIGCIIYSDPRDDGYFDGDVYPKGAYRNQDGAQRGSIADMPLYSGDPLTPGVGATENAHRLSLKDAKVMAKIPTLPISYGDATPLLAALGGPVAPEEWRGDLPLTYHIGPGPARVHLKVAFNWDLVPAYDVIGTVRGSERPDEWIIRGNHHDAWVFGAEDPLSGQVGMLEEARGIGSLLSTGWRPKRTIVYCAWDGEEPGLLGSTEWVETHADVLKQKAVVYINSDSNGRGFLYVGGSHTLERFANQVARDVTDPERRISVEDRLRALRLSESQGEGFREALGEKGAHIGALGSGSDYTPFIQHLGIAALNIGYGGEDGGGSYHSVYDSYSYYTRFMDTNFVYGIALAQTGGRMVLRFADADIFPIDFQGFTETVGKYIKEVTKLADDMRAQTEEFNQKIKDHDAQVASDPHQVYIEPKPKDPVPYINFAPLLNALSTLQQSAGNFLRAMPNPDSVSLPPDRIQELNAILMNAERTLTRKEGLPGRPWYTHEIYAPGLYTGYGVKTLPAIREALELRKWKEAEEQTRVVAGVLEDYAHLIDRATALLTGSAR